MMKLAGCFAVWQIIQKSSSQEITNDSNKHEELAIKTAYYLLSLKTKNYDLL